MQKIILLITLFIISFTAINAQNVGIGTTTPNPSAKLDIEDSNKGLLIPRINIPNLNAAPPVTTPATSLLVYNTNTTSGIGYYYWDGVRWNRIQDQSTSKWVEGSEVGLTSGVIYANEALANGDTVIVDPNGAISSNDLDIINKKINSLGAGPREIFRISNAYLCTGGIFSVSATRTNFVHTSNWSWNSNHNATGKGMLTKLSGGEYDPITLYLDVKSNGDAIISADWGAAQSINISILKLSGNKLDLTQAGNNWTTPNSGYMRVDTVATKPLSLQTKNGLFSGNLGVKTTNPLGNLHVYNPNPYTGNENNNISNSLVLHGSVSNSIGNHYGGITWASGGRKRAGISSVMEHSDADYLGLAFWTQGTDGPGPMYESMRISHNGNVGIGTTSPTATLDARGSMMLENRLLIGNTNQSHFFSNSITGMTDGIASSDAFLFVPLHTTGTEVSELRLYMTDNTDESFSIWGGTCTGGNCNDLNTASQRFKVRADGLVTINGLGAGTVQSDANGNLSVSSDERLKNIIQNFDRGLESLIKIQPIQYKWNEISKLETQQIYTGFSAQNVQENIPEAVGIDTDGYLTLDNRPIIATLVNAIQEQQLQLTDANTSNQKLATELATLKQENEKIKAQLTEIESMKAEIKTIKNLLATHAQK